MNVKAIVGLTVAMALPIETSALADTYLHVVNQTGHDITTGHSDSDQSQLLPNLTVNRSLPLLVIAPGSRSYRIYDSHEHCTKGDTSRWDIRTDVVETSGSSYTSNYCIKLTWFEVGCLEVKVGRYSINFSKKPDTECHTAK